MLRFPPYRQGAAGCVMNASPEEGHSQRRYHWRQADLRADDALWAENDVRGNIEATYACERRGPQRCDGLSALRSTTAIPRQTSREPKQGLGNRRPVCAAASE